MKQQIVAIKKIQENQDNLTIHEARNLAEQIKTITREAEQQFKSAESKIKTCAPLIERMIKCKGEEGKNGWELIGYKNFSEWAKEHLDYKYTYSRLFYKAVIAYIELKESQRQEIVEFAKDACVGHLAAIGNAPPGKREEAVMLVKKMAKQTSEETITERVIDIAVETLKPIGVEEDKLKTLTSPTLTATNKEWIKAKTAANSETLQLAADYWKKELPQAERKKPIESRIDALKKRIEYLNSKENSSSPRPSVGKRENPEARAERQEVKKNLSIEFSTDGLLSIEDPETLATYLEVVPTDRVWNELQTIKQREEKLLDNLDAAALEIVRLEREVKRIRDELIVMQKNQACVRSEWEIELVDIVGQLNGRKSLALN